MKNLCYVIVIALLFMGSLICGSCCRNEAIGNRDEESALEIVFAYPGGIGTINMCETEWGTPIIVAFSAPIDVSTVTDSTFVVSDHIEGQIEVCGNTVVFKPAFAFNNLISIKVRVGAEIGDLKGNALGEDYEFIFCTRGEP